MEAAAAASAGAAELRELWGSSGIEADAVSALSRPSNVDIAYGKATSR